MRKLAIIFMVMISALSSLGIGFLGPVDWIYVIRRFSATFVHVGILSAVFCLVAAIGFEPLFLLCSGCHAITGSFVVKSREGIS